MSLAPVQPTNPPSISLDDLRDYLTKRAILHDTWACDAVARGDTHRTSCHMASSLAIIDTIAALFNLSHDETRQLHHDVADAGYRQSLAVSRDTLRHFGRQ